MQSFKRVIPTQRAAVSIVLGFSASTVLLFHGHKQAKSTPTVIRFTVSSGSETTAERRAVSQISAGSLAGFGMGLGVVYFSRMITIVASIVAAVVWAALRYDISAAQILRVGKMVGMPGDKEQGIWHKCQQNKPFSVAFAVAFASAVFVQF